MASTDGTASKGWLARIWWFVAAVGLPTAVGGIWRTLPTKHPVTAVLLLLAYWVVLAASRFAGAVGGKLSERWRDRLVEQLDRASVRRLSGFGKRYIDYVLGSLRFIDQKGLPTVGFYTPELDEVFVDVSLARRSPHEASADPLADLPADVTERLSLRDLLDSDDPVVLAVTGAPGSGKTTLLRHTARHICLSPRRRRRRVPMLLYLRDHATAIIEKRNDGLPGLLRGTLGRYGPEPEGWFEQQLREGNCVVLLDGLDEVAQDEDRRIVSAWVERQIAQYPKNDYVITSRPGGYRTASIEGATVLQARRFTEYQVTRFIRGWYLAMERRSTGADGEDVRMLATAGADDLLHRLKGSPALYELTANPLLLTMIANVHRFRGALPGSRADLYRDICEVMLWRRQEAKRLAAELSGEHKEVLLRALAFSMMRRNVRDLATAEIIDAIRPGLARISSALSSQDFLGDVGSSGLLVERENGVYSFAHHTFQEYLAATHIRERGLVSVLARAVDDVWWRETTLLYAARSDTDPIVTACLESGSLTALTLAFDCAEQGTELAPELRRRLDELISLGEDPAAAPDRRRLAAGVLIARQLRRVIPVSQGGRICAQPITKGVYQQFLVDMNNLGQRREPDGPWAARSANDPVVGVRAADALAFVGWVNDVIGAPDYRLPTGQELDDPAARIALGTSSHSFWLHPLHPGDYPEKWTITGTSQPHSIEESTVIEQLTHDIENAPNIILTLLLIRSVIAMSLIVQAADIAKGSKLRHALETACELASDVLRDIAHARQLIAQEEIHHRLTDTHSLASELARELSRARDLVTITTGDYDGDPTDRVASLIARNHDRALAIARKLSLHFALERTSEPTFELIRKLALDIVRNLSQDVDRALELATELARELDREVDRDRALGNHTHAIDLIGTLVAGLALGRSLAHALRSSGLALNPQGAKTEWRNFFQQFAREVRIKSATYIVSLDSLTDEARINSLFEAPAMQPSTEWGHEKSKDLQRAIARIVRREPGLERSSVVAIRLASICLAAEIEAHDSTPDAGDVFREIAAGITLLENRLLGENPPDEAIILALE